MKNGQAVKPPIYKQTVPSDGAAIKAWKQIMDLASSHGLILQAYGGVATLALPSDQRRAGLRHQVLQAIQMNETKEQET